MHAVGSIAPARRRMLTAAIAALTAAACLAFAAAPAAAKYSGPKLLTPRADLAAAFHCPIDPAGSKKTPVMFVTGTGATGQQGYLIGQDAFEAAGHPVCYVDFPDFTTADIQVSVEYLVFGLRKEFKLAGGRKVAVIGISQGGLLPRFALTYWPDLQRKVGDVLAAAGTQHGTTAGSFDCSAASPCIPAGWQQAKGSNLLRAINSQPDESPGDTSFTTVRSLADETVQPQDGKHPTSSLQGATNILIQDVCPGRETTHIGTALDSVTFAAFIDAMADDDEGKKGAAKVSRLPGDVCDHPYAPGLDEAKTDAFLAGSGALVGSQSDSSPKVGAEPKVRSVFKKIAKR